MLDRRFRCGDIDHYFYFRLEGNSHLILFLYVDDMLIIGASMKKINMLKSDMLKALEMKDLRAAKHILDMYISQDQTEETLILSQERYVNKVLESSQIQDAEPRSMLLGAETNLSKSQALRSEEKHDHMSRIPYASMVGSLIYTMACTRPDIFHVVGVVSRYMTNSGKAYRKVVE